MQIPILLQRMKNWKNKRKELDQTDQIIAGVEKKKKMINIITHWTGPMEYMQRFCGISTLDVPRVVAHGREKIAGREVQPPNIILSVVIRM